MATEGFLEVTGQKDKLTAPRFIFSGEGITGTYQAGDFTENGIACVGRLTVKQGTGSWTYAVTYTRDDKLAVSDEYFRLLYIKMADSVLRVNGFTDIRSGDGGTSCRCWKVLGTGETLSEGAELVFDTDRYMKPDTVGKIAASDNKEIGDYMFTYTWGGFTIKDYIKYHTGGVKVESVSENGNMINIRENVKRLKDEGGNEYFQLGLEGLGETLGENAEFVFSDADSSLCPDPSKVMASDNAARGGYMLNLTFQGGVTRKCYVNYSVIELRDGNFDIQSAETPSGENLIIDTGFSYYQNAAGEVSTSAEEFQESEDRYAVTLVGNAGLLELQTKLTFNESGTVPDKVEFKTLEGETASVKKLFTHKLVYTCGGYTYTQYVIYRRKFCSVESVVAEGYDMRVNSQETRRNQDGSTYQYIVLTGKKSTLEDPSAVEFDFGVDGDFYPGNYQFGASGGDSRGKYKLELTYTDDTDATKSYLDAYFVDYQLMELSNEDFYPESAVTSEGNEILCESRDYYVDNTTKAVSIAYPEDYAEDKYTGGKYINMTGEGPLDTDGRVAITFEANNVSGWVPESYEILPRASADPAAFNYKLNYKYGDAAGTMYILYTDTSVEEAQ